jgi:hypothetical protein
MRVQFARGISAVDFEPGEITVSGEPLQEAR